MDVNKCHVHFLVLVDDLNLRVLVLSLDALVELLDVRNELWNNLLKVLKRPCLKGFSKDCVVCVSTCLADSLDSVIDVESLVLNENSDKLRNDHCRMCVIDLDNRMVVELVKVVLTLFLLLQNKLCCI